MFITCICWSLLSWVNTFRLSWCLGITRKIICSVVTTIELSPPPRWLATTEPTPPSRYFIVFSAVFLGAVSWLLPLTSTEQRQSSKCCVIPRERTARQSSLRHCLLSPARPLPHSKTTGLHCRNSRDSLGTVVY